jgi:uncharacterized protein (DUF697 family)
MFIPGGSVVQRFGALGAMRTMMDVLREVSLDELREQAEKSPRLIVVAPDAEEARRLGQALTGPEGQLATIFRAVNEPIDSIGHTDAAVVWDPQRTGAESRVSEALRYESPPVPIVRFDGSGPDDGEAIARVRADILTRSADRAPAFGRALPAFRAAAAKQVIDETSAANAQFSLVSNIPTLLPIVGNIAAAGADFIVLTKNQVMMLYKLAAIHGRDLRDQRAILQEVLPVVGAGLIWRTVARQATTWLPFAAGTIPKLAIAYMGTMAVGRAADFYYRTGLKPTRAQMNQFTRQAALRLHHLDLPGMRRLLKRNGTEVKMREVPGSTAIPGNDDVPHVQTGGRQ